MKVLKKILKSFLVLIVIACLIIGLFFRQEVYRLYKVVTFFEPENISENFRNTTHIFPTRVVPKSTHPYRFAYSKMKFS
ncbi:hypothetical protein, partial [Tamlana flava]|uniref:hypothetical protein n=1 Tax=Tamlana flava TaxID=3158572 RepID=UPI00351BB1BF